MRRGERLSPITKRGNCFFSSTTVANPACWSSAAADEPAGPAPRMVTSQDEGRSTVRPSHRAQKERRVDAAKGEVVGHDRPGTRLAWAAAHVVERRAARIDLIEIAVCGEETVAHHRQAKHGLDRATGSQRVARVALGRADRDLVSQYLEAGGALRDVAELGGRAMRVDVVDGVDRRGRVLEAEGGWGRHPPGGGGWLVCGVAGGGGARR